LRGRSRTRMRKAGEAVDQQPNSKLDPTCVRSGEFERAAMCPAGMAAVLAA
jgi:hypothetical protein